MKCVLITLLCFTVVYGKFIINADDVESEKTNLKSFDLSSLVKRFGYPFEKHTVTTDDGYKLEIHRVQYSPVNSGTDNRPPVLIMHGLLSSSADFFHLGPGKSLPLRLADEGYDVWLGNNRGNTYGRNHETIKADNSTFWDFSFDEIGRLDTSAIIDHILMDTSTKQLSFVGHSTGVAQFLILTATNVEYNDKVNVMAALAPAVYMEHATSLLLNLDYGLFLAAEQLLGSPELLRHSFITDVIFGIICSDKKNLTELCVDLSFLITGFDSDELDRTNFHEFLKTFPAGASTKQFNHFLQMKATGLFREYDYGKIENLIRYQNISPPAYDLSNVNTPVALFYGKNDYIVSSTDVDQLAEDLGNVVEKHLIEYEKFNHIDFILADDIDSLVNYYVVNTLNSYNNKQNISSTTSAQPDVTTAQSTPTNTGSTQPHVTTTQSIPTKTGSTQPHVTTTQSIPTKTGSTQSDATTQNTPTTPSTSSMNIPSIVTIAIISLLTVLTHRSISLL